jgi:hypothetical protein
VRPNRGCVMVARASSLSRSSAWPGCGPRARCWAPGR